MKDKFIEELENQELHWVQPSLWNSRYELHNVDDEVVASITQKGWMKNRAEVDALGNRWEFERRGIFRYHIIIRSAATGEEPARFDYNWSVDGGWLTFTDGRRFRWRRGNFMGTKWAWVNELDEPIMGFQTGGLFRLNGEIDIDPDVTMKTRTLPLLLFLGWFLIALHRSDAAAVAATAG